MLHAESTISASCCWSWSVGTLWVVLAVGRQLTCEGLAQGGWLLLLLYIYI